MGALNKREVAVLPGNLGEMDKTDYSQKGIENLYLVYNLKRAWVQRPEEPRDIPSLSYKQSDVV